MSFLSILVRLFSANAFSNYLALIVTNRIIQWRNLILEILELSFSTVVWKCAQQVNILLKLQTRNEIFWNISWLIKIFWTNIYSQVWFCPGDEVTAALVPGRVRTLETVPASPLSPPCRSLPASSHSHWALLVLPPLVTIYHYNGS